MPIEDMLHLKTDAVDIVLNSAWGAVTMNVGQILKPIWAGRLRRLVSRSVR
ncbi:MAG: hypothetical protein H6869_10320 [Rhodospirillales bacterium]|nr:hypothetical protein [Rhodospirillales bacterium]